MEIRSGKPTQSSCVGVKHGVSANGQSLFVSGNDWRFSRHPEEKDIRRLAFSWSKGWHSIKSAGSGWRWLACFLLPCLTTNLFANPQGMSVAAGNANATAKGPNLDIRTTSRNTFLNWQSFNIAPGETTTFRQPSASSVVWNRINDPNPSQIWGHLNANGIVVLMNQSGFYFGPGSVVNAAGFVATTATTLPEFRVDSAWQFSGPPPAASIINYGEIKTKAGGSAFLIAEKVENHGVLTAPDGTLGLYAGKEVLVSERPDGRGISVSVKLPAGSVDNSGTLVADAGTVLLHANTVNQNGVIQANTVRRRNGVVELLASESIHLGADSIIEARGGAGVGTGGKITIKADDSFTDQAGSRIAITGGARGGNGGWAEISAPSMAEIVSRVDGSTVSGFRGGSLLIDPTDINIGPTGTGSYDSGTSAGTGPATLSLNFNSAFIGLSTIALQATHNITIRAATGGGATTWDLEGSTGVSSPGSTLSLEAGTDIMLQNNVTLRAGSGWSLSLKAGRDFSSADGIVSGTGNITLGTASVIEATGTPGTAGTAGARDGSITLLAGNNVTLGSGAIRTSGGGNISVSALAGTVNTGTRQNGFTFLPTADLTQNSHMLVDAQLGGISTRAGGDVSISSGLDIISFLPQGLITSPTGPTDAGSGAFGLEPGNVTLTAGRDVVGHYVLRNGVGTISAGHDAGHIGGTPLALSLSAGRWDVHADHDIGLQEVRNPNGVYNNFKSSGQGTLPSPANHYFEYSRDAAVSLDAGNAVQLVGSNLPRRPGLESSFPVIFAPSLFVSAGAGGILLRNDIPLTLFPSPIGQLTLATTGGGSFRGVSPTAGTSDTGSGLATIVMSDSAASQWSSSTSFGLFDRSPVPLHLNDPNPIRANISGNMNNVLLISPKSIDLTIAGNMNNSRFNIQNLHPSDVSRLNVGGDIINQNEFSIVPLATAPDLTLLERAYPALPPELAGLAGKLHYDNTSHTLIFRGHMTDAELQALEHVQVQALDPKFNTPLVDKDGNPVLVTLSVLDAGTAQGLFDLSQKVPSNPDTGYLVGGPGALSVNARNMDLGASLGIRSLGPLDNPTLARLGYSGASISVKLDGDLDMFSTTISSVAGGDVQVFAKGSVNVGSSVFTGDQLARGIFTVAKSDVSVIAGGNININGSRIAAYDGGSILVESLTGNVDAGHGGQGAAQVEKVVVDPATGQIKTYTPTIPGSGILATTFPHPLDKTFPDSLNTVGNITVLTPRGDIIASAGGIVQASLNGVKSPDSKVTLIAGSTDASGKVLYTGNVDASGSGVIGANVRIKATGSIKGLVVSQGDITLGAGQNINVTAIGVGNVSVAAGGSVSGTIVGVAGLAASGSSIDAALLSQNVTTSGSLAGAQVGFAAANAAGSTSQSALSGDQETKKTIVAPAEETTDDMKKRRGGAPPTVARRVGRVTVILPKS